MAGKQYELRFLNLSGLDAVEMQHELGQAARIIKPERPPSAHGDLTLLAVGVVLGARALTAALIYFGRARSSTKIRLAMQVESPDGTITNLAIEVDSSVEEALSEQALKQIADALKIKPSDIADLE